MKVIMLLAVVTYYSTLSQAAAGQLVERFLARQHPTVTIIFNTGKLFESAAPFARAGLARVSHTEDSCFGPIRTYVPSKALLTMAKHKGWVVRAEQYGGTAIDIPIGTYEYVRGSASVQELPSFTRVTYDYRLVPNENVKTLLFFAPAAAWAFADTTSTRANESLADVQQTRRASVSVWVSNSRWTFSDTKLAGGTMLCPDGLPTLEP